MAMEHLTKREFQVFRLMALGYTHPRISKVMKVLPSGIKTYKTNIYKKLDVFYPANKTFMYPMHVKKLDTDLKNLGLAIQKLF